MSNSSNVVCGTQQPRVLIRFTLVLYTPCSTIHHLIHDADARSKELEDLAPDVRLAAKLLVLVARARIVGEDGQILHKLSTTGSESHWNRCCALQVHIRSFTMESDPLAVTLSIRLFTAGGVVMTTALFCFAERSLACSERLPTVARSHWKL